MIKVRELSDPTSCLNRAREDERVFVLLERDAAAPVAIRAWVAERLRLGKNQIYDIQIREALDCAALMEAARQIDTGGRYQGEYECPQCGMGSADLKPEALALIVERFGQTFSLCCDICRHRFVKTLRPAGLPPNSVRSGVEPPEVGGANKEKAAE